ERHDELADAHSPFLSRRIELAVETGLVEALRSAPASLEEVPLDVAKRLDRNQEIDHAAIGVDGNPGRRTDLGLEEDEIVRGELVFHLLARQLVRVEEPLEVLEGRLEARSLDRRNLHGRT